MLGAVLLVAVAYAIDYAVLRFRIASQPERDGNRYGPPGLRSTAKKSQH